MRSHIHIAALSGEPPCTASVVVRRGCPRLVVNGEETYPLAGWSWNLKQSTPIYRQAGIGIIHPILGMNAVWPGPDRFDWSSFDVVFDDLLRLHPEAFFLPRILFDVPDWWFDLYPHDLAEGALPVTADGIQYRTSRLSEEGGMRWTNPVRAPSLASDQWRGDMERIYRAFLTHVEKSPIRSRIVGYQVGAGIYGEWHYWLSEFMPDVGPAARKRIGPIPAAKSRLETTHGLLRDPVQEAAVIAYYRRFHEELCAPVLLHFAALTKEMTARRVLCGAFYGYLLENVWMQEGGHLAPALILGSDDIDFLASPYTYQTTNVDGLPWWAHDVTDEAGNYLGRARGIGGDGGYRVLLESLKRHGKLYFAELDAGTFLAPPPGDLQGPNADIDALLSMIGGEGSDTMKGTTQILSRDLGRAWASGAGAWLFDFGPATSLQRSWYDDSEIVLLLKRFSELGALRDDLDMDSCAEIAVVCDAESFYYTRHWRAEKKLNEAAALDYFSQWFLDSQARSIHRIGAPVDFLYRFDLKAEDLERYKILLMLNSFYMGESEVQRIHRLLRHSGATVVWYYAPGFLSPHGTRREQMEHLTGFGYEVLREPGPMLIDCTLPQTGPMRFGVEKPEYPRFAVVGCDDVMGTWSDGSGTAFASTHLDGWHSIYVGAAPLPVEILTHLAGQAGVKRWTDRSDIVVASKGAAIVVATDDGPRVLTFPHRFVPVDGGVASRQHHVDMCAGDVTLFVARESKTDTSDR